MKERIHKLDFIKIRFFCSAKDTVKRIKDKPKRLGEKYLQKTYLTKDCYPKHLKNS